MTCGMLSVCACLSRQSPCTNNGYKTRSKNKFLEPENCQPVRQMNNLIQKQMNYYTNII